RRDHQGMAVRRGTKDVGRADIAGGAAAVLDNDRLPPFARELIGKEPAQNVSAATGGVGGDEAHGPCRILRLGAAQVRSREQGERGQSNQAHARSLWFAAIVSFLHRVRFVKTIKRRNRRVGHKGVLRPSSTGYGRWHRISMCRSLSCAVPR